MGRGRSYGERRTRVFRRDGYCCVYCREVQPEEALTLDHVEPRMRGGDASEGNLVTCCSRCNRLKAGLPAWKFLALHPELRANFLLATAPDTSGGETHASPVWRRLRRAVEEAAARLDE